MKKVNGLTRKAHPFQIISYITFLVIFITYFLITFPLSTLSARIVGAILQIVTSLCVFISGYIVTTTDTSDTFLLETLKARAEGDLRVIQKSEYLCSYDKAYVHESSKHCKRCGRCTEGFDHHCKWVNNDIGKKNYKAFVTMIVCVLFFLTVFLVFGALVTAHYAKDHDFVKHEIYMFHKSSEDLLPGLVILWVIMACAIVLFILDLNLVFFHFFLIRKGLTTFQYLTLVEERRDNKKEMEIAVKAMGDQKKTWLDFVLCLGEKKKKRTRKNSLQLQNQENKKVSKEEAQKALPNQEQRDSLKSDETKPVCGTEPEFDHDPHTNTRIITNMETDANHHHIEFLRTEENMLLSHKNEARINIRKGFEKLNEGVDALPSSESPAQTDQFSERATSDRVHELRYETYQVKKHFPGDKDPQAVSPTDKEGKFFLNLDALDQNDLRNLGSGNQSSHNNMYSFEKTNEEINGVSQSEKGQFLNGKSTFALQQLVSKNKVQI